MKLSELIIKLQEFQSDLKERYIAPEYFDPEVIVVSELHEYGTPLDENEPIYMPSFGDDKTIWLCVADEAKIEREQ